MRDETWPDAQTAKKKLKNPIKHGNMDNSQLNFMYATVEQNSGNIQEMENTALR